MERLLYAPLLITTAGALAAAAASLSGLNRRLTVTRLAWLLALAPLATFGLLLRTIAVLGDGPACGDRGEQNNGQAAHVGPSSMISPHVNRAAGSTQRSGGGRRRDR